MWLRFATDGDVMDFIDTPVQSRDKTILELREFSRKLVRELGFMRSTLADSDLAPSAVHAILEIGRASCRERV